MIQSEYPHLVQIMEPQIVSANVSDFVSQRRHFCSSLPKPREQTWLVSKFLRMPRITRSTPTPTPPAEAVPTVVMAKQYIGSASSEKVHGSKRKRGQCYASASELPLSPEFQFFFAACSRKD